MILKQTSAGISLVGSNKSIQLTFSRFWGGGTFDFGGQSSLKSSCIAQPSSSCNLFTMRAIRASLANQNLNASSRFSHAQKVSNQCLILGEMQKWRFSIPLEKAWACEEDRVAGRFKVVKHKSHLGNLGISSEFWKPYCNWPQSHPLQLRRALPAQQWHAPSKLQCHTWVKWQNYIKHILGFIQGKLL